MKRDPNIVQQIYYVLPVEERRPAGIPACSCKHPMCTNEWDTRAIGLDGSVWNVHYPDLRDGTVKAQAEIARLKVLGRVLTDAEWDLLFAAESVLRAAGLLQGATYNED